MAKPSLPADRGHIDTEKVNPRSRGLHELDVPSLVHTIRDEDRRLHDAVALAEPDIVAFIERAEPGFLRGGRLIYLGAGTSGRLGVLDASEAPPTFCVEPGRIVGIIAGGDSALRKSSEGKEDDSDGALPALSALNLGPDDAVLGIAAGGTTPYVQGALAWVHGLGLGIPACLLTMSDVSVPDGCGRIYVPTGPEIVTGSTRMKAGTATKMVLNTLSTSLMIREGRVYDNLMVDVRASNEKLRDRAARIIDRLTGVGRVRSLQLLDEVDGSAKAAVVMARMQVDAQTALTLLREAGGRLDNIL